MLAFLTHKTHFILFISIKSRIFLFTIHMFYIYSFLGILFSGGGGVKVLYRTEMKTMCWHWRIEKQIKQHNVLYLLYMFEKKKIP